VKDQERAKNCRSFLSARLFILLAKESGTTTFAGVVSWLDEEVFYWIEQNNSEDEGVYNYSLFELVMDNADVIEWVDNCSLSERRVGQPLIQLVLDIS